MLSKSESAFLTKNVNTLKTFDSSVYLALKVHNIKQCEATGENVWLKTIEARVLAQK